MLFVSMISDSLEARIFVHLPGILHSLNAPCLHASSGGKVHFGVLTQQAIVKEIQARYLGVPGVPDAKLEMQQKQ